MWWMYVAVAALFLLGIYAFFSLVGFERRLMTRKTFRRAEDLYPAYDDGLKRRRWLHR